MITTSLITSRRIIALPFLALALAGCGGNLDANADTQARIVSLGGDLTEIVAALGADTDLVARDATSSYPPNILDLPDVGYVRALSAEGILALSPTLVIASAEAGPPEAIEQLRAAGVEIVIPPAGHSEAALLERIDVIGTALSLDDKADALEIEIAGRIDAATHSTAETSPKVLFLLSGRDGSPMAAGTDTAAHAMIQLAGGTNVFDTHSGYKAYSFEAMAEAAPDVIMMMDHSLAQMGGVEGLANHPAIGLTPAAQNGKIIAADGTFLLGFGPRLPDAIEFVSEGFETNSTTSLSSQ